MKLLGNFLLMVVVMVLVTNLFTNLSRADDLLDGGYLEGDNIRSNNSRGCQPRHRGQCTATLPCCKPHVCRYWGHVTSKVFRYVCMLPNTKLCAKPGEDCSTDVCCEETFHNFCKYTVVNRTLGQHCISPVYEELEPSPPLPWPP